MPTLSGLKRRVRRPETGDFFAGAFFVPAFWIQVMNPTADSVVQWSGNQTQQWLLAGALQWD